MRAFSDNRYIGFCSHQDRKEEHPLRKGRLNRKPGKAKGERHSHRERKKLWLPIIMLIDWQCSTWNINTHFQNVEMDNTLFVHAFNGGFIMTPKEKAKKAPIKKDDLVNEILKLEDGFTKKALNRINMIHLNLIKTILTR